MFINPVFNIIWKYRDSAVDITMSYALDGWSSIPDCVKRLFFIPQRADRL
jgi:hypothetical protein